MSSHGPESRRRKKAQRRFMESRREGCGEPRMLPNVVAWRGVPQVPALQGSGSRCQGGLCPWEGRRYISTAGLIWAAIGCRYQGTRVTPALRKSTRSANSLWKDCRDVCCTCGRGFILLRRCILGILLRQLRITPEIQCRNSMS